VLHLQLIIFLVRGDVPVDSKVLLVIDFVNFKIKSIQSFEGGRMDRMHVFIRVSAHTRISICISTMFLSSDSRLDVGIIADDVYVV
jgi:hypothetical protein